MTRQVTEHTALSSDRERLSVITVYEQGINKEQVKKINRFSKRHHVLVPRGNEFDWK